jgi:ligand-binding SRPBCC domain-containing protein
MKAGVGKLNMKKHLFETEIEFEEPLDRVFEFFCRAENLDFLTPPWLRFRFITTLPIEMRESALIEYRLKLYGVPVRWKTKITEWDPPHSFQDTQARGPFRHWIHTHYFEERNGGTLMRDRVEYAVPGWIFAPIAHRFFVRGNIIRIFTYRREQLSKIFSIRREHEQGK